MRGVLVLVLVLGMRRRGVVWESRRCGESD